MAIYLLINVLIVISGIIFKNIRYNNYLYKNNYKNNSELITMIFSFTLLFFISGFRGAFTTDYARYLNLFKYYNHFSFSDIFRYNFGQEFGYVLLNKIIGLFTNNSIYVGIVTSFIILFFFFKEIKKHSDIVWLSVLMFVTIGSFYTSFNIIRQIIAASIIFSASDYIYERKMFKYFISIIFAMLFHKTALIMIIFYFLLTFKQNKKNIFLITIIFTVIFININNILIFVQKFVYSHYTQNSYGMTGYSYKNIVIPVAILIFVLCHMSKLDLNDIKTRVWVNAVVYYALFSVLGLKIQMIQRIAEFFSPYVLLIVPRIIISIHNKNERIIYLTLAIFLLISYNFVALHGTGYDPYYFIWESN